MNVNDEMNVSSADVYGFLAGVGLTGGIGCYLATAIFNVDVPFNAEALITLTLLGSFWLSGCAACV